MIINRANLVGLNTAFNALFQNAFASATSLYSRIAEDVPSSTSEENYGWLGSMPGMREWIGPRVVNNIADSSYTLKNKTWEDTISVPRERIEDDQYGVYNPIFRALGTAAQTHPDELVWSGLLNGFSSNCYDGQYYFDTDHPVINPSTGTTTSVSNMQAGSGPAWFLLDTTKAIKPLIFQKRRPVAFQSKTNLSDDNVFFEKQFIWGADARYNMGYGFWQMAFGSRATLTKENMRAGRLAMSTLTDDNGKKLAIRPNLLVVGPSLSDTARDLLKAERLANGASNVDLNLLEILESPWLE